jgi:hypothetical protein
MQAESFQEILLCKMLWSHTRSVRGFEMEEIAVL